MSKFLKERAGRSAAGFIIGPIVWAIAVLAAITGIFVISAGGFGGSTSQETNKLTAGAVIEQASNLKAAVSRLLAFGTDTTQLIVSNDLTGATATQQTQAIYSSTGGNLTIQTPPPAAIPVATNIWRFVNNATISGIGSGANYIAVLPISSQSVCLAINSQIFGNGSAQATAATIPTLATAPTAAEVTAALGTTSGTNTFTTASATGATIANSAQACVKQGANYWFYSLLAAG